MEEYTWFLFDHKAYENLRQRTEYKKMENFCIEKTLWMEKFYEALCEEKSDEIDEIVCLECPPPGTKYLELDEEAVVRIAVRAERRREWPDQPETNARCLELLNNTYLKKCGFILKLQRYEGRSKKKIYRMYDYDRHCEWKTMIRSTEKCKEPDDRHKRNIWRIDDVNSWTSPGISKCNK